MTWDEVYGAIKYSLYRDGSLVHVCSKINNGENTVEASTIYTYDLTATVGNVTTKDATLIWRHQLVILFLKVVLVAYN